MKQLSKEKEFADAPQAHPNLILGSLQLAVWIFFHPTAWRNHVKRIDDKLRPDFSLAELKRSHWRHPGLRRLLVQGYLILPLLATVLSTLGPGRLLGNAELFLVSFVSTALSSITYSLILGSSASFAIGIGAGLALSLVYPTVTLALLNILSLIYTEVPSNLGAVVSNSVSAGVTYGFISSIALCLANKKSAFSLKKRVKGIAAGALSFLLLNLANGVIYQLAQANFKSSWVLSLVVSIALVSCLRAIFLSAAIGWELKRWRRGIVFGIVFAVFLTGMSIVGFAGNSIKVDESLAIVYRIAFSTSTGAISAIAFALPFVVGRQLGGAIAGVGAFVLCGVLQQVLVPTINLPVMLTALAGIGFGLTQTWWRSLLLYPLMVIWNFLSVSNLRLNSAFWDEFQELPLLGMEKRLIVAAEKKPGEARSAIAYLMNTPQKAAARAAKIELTLRSWEDCNNIEAIARAHYQCSLDELTTEVPVWVEKLCAISLQVEVVLDGDGKDGLNAVAESLTSLGREMDEKGDRLAPRGQSIVDSWGKIIGN